MTSQMKGLLKGLRYIARIFEDEKEPDMQIGIPTDVKHVAHIGWEGPSATTPSWMHDFKSQDRTKTETKGSSNKKPGSSGEKHRNKGRRKTSTGNNSPTESPSRAGGSMRPSKRSTGKQREQSTGSGSESSGLELPQQTDQPVGPKHSRQRKSKGSAGGGGGGGGGGGEPLPPNGPVKSKETDISVRAVYPCAGLGSSTGR
ncbi:PREDICTED: CRIB domain-containing protein RIC5-like [Camelina sativa]|uniref:CRIB domain-containing protein RIC5-like n=1 Tax=Camelina sativa TaxID=90675 RepID=A0ABM0XN62_CAMSA|nr:PREDICTED: CRIB domain-containing protein RIC5-like [Camelina sativa]